MLCVYLCLNECVVDKVPISDQALRQLFLNQTHHTRRHSHPLIQLPHTAARLAQPHAPHSQQADIRLPQQRVTRMQHLRVVVETVGAAQTQRGGLLLQRQTQAAVLAAEELL